MTATQGLPPAGADLTAFPEETVPAGATMYRAHGSGRTAWWFDSGDEGRFNLHGSRGTCCTASTVDTAVREKVRNHVSETGVVSHAMAASFVVSVVSAPLPHRCAAVNSDAAVKHRVVRELVTMRDYSVPQAWAQAFDDSGYDGVFYETAFTTGGPSAYALFGDAGAPPSGAGHTEVQHLSGAEACDEVGFTVAPPTSRGMPVIS
jgi:hypothetical protein